MHEGSLPFNMFIIISVCLFDFNQTYNELKSSTAALIVLIEALDRNFGLPLITCTLHTENHPDHRHVLL